MPVSESDYLRRGPSLGCEVRRRLPTELWEHRLLAGDYCQLSDLTGKTLYARGAEGNLRHATLLQLGLHGHSAADFDFSFLD
jgi:hypothetical protein